MALLANGGAPTTSTPPFGAIMHQGKRKGTTAWVRKAVMEQHKGKFVVMVLPLFKWQFMLQPDLRNLGDIRWLSTEDQTPGPGVGRHIAAFILRPQSKC